MWGSFRDAGAKDAGWKVKKRGFRNAALPQTHSEALSRLGAALRSFRSLISLILSLWMIKDRSSQRTERPSSVKTLRVVCVSKRNWDSAASMDKNQFFPRFGMITAWRGFAETTVQMSGREVESAPVDFFPQFGIRQCTRYFARCGSGSALKFIPGRLERAGRNLHLFGGFHEVKSSLRATQ